MFQEMMPMGGTVGGGSVDFLTPTYSNSNKTISGSWGYDADCVIMYGNLGANVESMVIDTSNGNFHAADSYSLKWGDYGTYGVASITITKRSFEITHNNGWSNINYIPVVNKPTVY